MNPTSVCSRQIASGFSLLLLLALLLPGCATVKPPVVSFDATAKYPAIGLVINDGYVHSHMEYAGYTAVNIVDQTSMVLRDELVSTGVFGAVQLNNPYQEILLNLSFVKKATDENIAKAVFQGGTLFLVPTTNKYATTAKVEVRVRAETIRTYTYTFNSNEMVFLGKNAYQGEHDLGKALWSAFLADAQKDRLFDELVPTSLARQRASIPSSAAASSPEKTGLFRFLSG